MKTIQEAEEDEASSSKKSYQVPDSDSEKDPFEIGVPQIEFKMSEPEFKVPEPEFESPAVKKVSKKKVTKKKKKKGTSLGPKNNTKKLNQPPSPQPSNFAKQ